MKLERIVLHDRARPYASREVVLGNKFTCRLNQNLDNFERATPDRDRHTTRTQFAPSEIDLPLAQLIHQSSALCAHSLPLFRTSHVSSEFSSTRAARLVLPLADNRCCVLRWGHRSLSGRASHFLRNTQNCFKELLGDAGLNTWHHTTWIPSMVNIPAGRAETSESKKN